MSNRERWEEGKQHREFHYCVEKLDGLLGSAKGLPTAVTTTVGELSTMVRSKAGGGAKLGLGQRC